MASSSITLIMKGLLVIIIHLKKIKELSNCRFFI